MSFAGADNDLPAEGSGLDYSNIGANQRSGAAKLPFSESLEDTASNAFMSGVRGVADYVDLSDQAYRARQDKQFNVDPTSDPGGAPIDPKEWQTKYGDLGLTFTPDMGQAQAQLLVDHKQHELQTQYVLDHSPDTFMAKTARGLTDFAVQAVDPLNVAAAFVPGIGETRAGLYAAKYGKTFARVAEGASAGATGMAALTPMQAIEAHAYQDHYGPMDAFMNVAFGAVLGGGLHAGFGAISDFMDRAAPETREAAMRGSIAQAVEGRPVDVAPVLATDPAIAPEITPTAAEPRAAPVGPSAADIAAAREDVKTSRAAAPTEPSLFNEIRSMGGIKLKDEAGNPTAGSAEIRDLLDTNRTLTNNKTGKPPDMVREALAERGWFNGNRDTSQTDLNDLHELMSKEASGGKVYHPDSDIHGNLAYRELLDRETTEANIKATDSLDAASKKLAEYRAARGDDLEARYQSEIGRDSEALSPEAREALSSHGYEPGQDNGAEFGERGGAGQAAGGEAVAGGPRGSGQDAGQAQGSSAIPEGARSEIARARQNSLNFSRGREDSAVAASPETEAHANAVLKAGDDPKAELADAESRVQAYKAQGFISDQEDAALTAANAADDEAVKNRTIATRALANCMFLTP